MAKKTSQEKERGKKSMRKRKGRRGTTASTLVPPGNVKRKKNQETMVKQNVGGTPHAWA